MEQANKTKIWQLLANGLNELEFRVSSRQQEQLIEFLLLLEKWNKVHNLTAVHNIFEMVSRHVLDSLLASSFLVGNNVLDVGTGAGLPGIPLSIVRPELQFVLLDSSRKRISFLAAVVQTLQLKNVTLVNSRVEQYCSAIAFEVIISRAFAKLAEFVTSSAHLCHQNGFFLAMKGKVSQVKNEPLPEGYLLTKIETVTVPGLIGERCLVFVSKETK